jgi:hypothetical protein
MRKKKVTATEHDVLLHFFLDPQGSWVNEQEDVWLQSHPYLIIMFPPGPIWDQWPILLPRYWQYLTQEQQDYWRERILTDVPPGHSCADSIRKLEKILEEKLLNEAWGAEEDGEDRMSR